MLQLRSNVKNSVLTYLQAKDENKLKAVQELSDSFDLIVAHPQYQTFLDHAMRVFLKILQVIRIFFRSRSPNLFVRIRNLVFLL
jgi:transformation/transcription domain-associated protein